MKKAVQGFILITLLSVVSLADEYAVISNKQMKDLSITQIKAIFLKKITYVEDVKVIPVNLEARDSLRLQFENDILEMDFSRLKAYWTSQHYLGHRPPVSVKSEDSVITFVKKVEGAVGYVHVRSLNDSVKILYKWSD
ncbi:hypothetical protein KKG72_00555 [bacterium]|nr:hypothetical protein [bacterium]